MKKHLKKFLFVAGFVAITAAANAKVWPIECEDGSAYLLITTETDRFLDLIAYLDACEALC
nr:hypothetical protein [uncultured Carboxylicivirga sp.]